MANNWGGGVVEGEPVDMFGYSMFGGAFPEFAFAYLPTISEFSRYTAVTQRDFPVSGYVVRE